MAIYDLGTASLAANGGVTGVGTTWKAPLTLIRVGATIIFKTSPLKIYTISEIISDTQINVYNPNSETVPSGTGYAILAHDGITVQGLAQDVAETLRYYQSKETSIEGLLQFIGQDTFDWPRFEKLANQSITGAAEALASQIAAAESASTAVGASNNAQNSYNRTVAAINAAGNTAAVAYFAEHGIGSTTTPALGSLDWQTMQFYSGGSYQCTIANMVNIPAALSSMFPATNTTICIDVLATRGINGSNVVRISPSTTSNAVFRVAEITITGKTGSRNFYVRELLSVPGGDAAAGGSSALRIRGLLDVYSKNETFQKSLNFSDVANKSSARTNLDVYSKIESDRKAPAISVKSFGAIGDGLDHPLSEIFSTLIEAQAKYPFVTSLDQTQDYAGIQSAINAAKQVNSAVFIPSGSYVINKTITIDYAASIYGEGGQGLRDINVNVHEPSPVRGTVINSKVTSGHCISISPPAYCFGLTIRDFAIWGVDGKCDKGLYLHNIGWMGIISGINVQKFPNQGIEIGYIQDTYFNNCSVVGCGNQYNYAVTCLTDSNYVYFNGCHFELSAYLLKLNSCWNFSWNQCHFEVARPVGAAVTEDDRYYYVSACVDLGSAYRLQFSNNTFIPVDAGYLSSKLGVDRGSVPYFMTGTGSYVSFTNDIWLAPEGSVDVGYFSGSQIDMKGCKFTGLSPSRPALYIENGLVSNCSFVPKVDEDNLRLFVAQVKNGSFIGNNIGFTFDSQQSTKRTSGFLFTGSAICSGNNFPSDNIVFKYLDNAATVTGFDGGKPRFVALPAGGDIDLTNYHPATNFRIDANNVVISHIYGAPYGRDLSITTNGTGTVINYSSDSVITQGAINFQLPQYRTSFLKSIDAGGSSLLFQIA